MCVAYIMRGLPGCGKSFLASRLADPAHICSTDDFYAGPDGVYVYDPDRLIEYHGRNLAKFARLCAQRVPAVVCDNTNMQRKHYAEYVAVAETNGYRVQIVTVGLPRDPAHQEACASRNSHGVDIDAIRKMASGYEV